MPRSLPPHLRLAQAELAASGLPAEVAGPVQVALLLAAAYYYATPQVSRTDQLRRDRNQTQAELEQVSAELLAVRQRVRRLEATVAELTERLAAVQPVAQQAAQRAAAEQVGAYMSVVHRLREALHELAASLAQPAPDADQQLASVRQQVACLLAGSSHRKHRQLAAQLLAVVDGDSPATRKKLE